MLLSHASATVNPTLSNGAMGSWIHSEDRSIQQCGYGIDAAVQQVLFQASALQTHQQQLCHSNPSACSAAVTCVIHTSSGQPQQ
jgi:hypothetical protein